MAAVAGAVAVAAAAVVVVVVVLILSSSLWLQEQQQPKSADFVGGRSNRRSDNNMNRNCNHRNRSKCDFTSVREKWFRNVSCGFNNNTPGHWCP